MVPAALVGASGAGVPADRPGGQLDRRGCVPWRLVLAVSIILALSMVCELAEWALCIIEGCSEDDQAALRGHIHLGPCIQEMGALRSPSRAPVLGWVDWCSAMRMGSKWAQAETVAAKGAEDVRPN